MKPPGPGEPHFRHEHGRLVAMLSHRVGLHHLETVEDAIQSALLTAFERWTAAGSLPDNPSAWLYQSALNTVVGELRQRARRDRLIEQHGIETRTQLPNPRRFPSKATSKTISSA